MRVNISRLWLSLCSLQWRAVMSRVSLVTAARNCSFQCCRCPTLPLTTRGVRLVRRWMAVICRSPAYRCELQQLVMMVMCGQSPSTTTTTGWTRQRTLQTIIVTTTTTTTMTASWQTSWNCNMATPTYIVKQCTINTTPFQVYYQFRYFIVHHGQSINRFYKQQKFRVFYCTVTLLRSTIKLNVLHALYVAHTRVGFLPGKPVSARHEV